MKYLTENFPCWLTVNADITMLPFSRKGIEREPVAYTTDGNQLSSDKHSEIKRNGKKC
jgi:hypothetical protein